MSNKGIDLIQVKAEYLTTFHSFSEWVNKASSRIGGYHKSEEIICIDTQGNSCNIGEDFMKARDNGLFPVKAYRLFRTTEFVDLAVERKEGV